MSLQLEIKMLAKMDKRMWQQVDANAEDMDWTVRATFNIPEDRYYSVTSFPKEKQGEIYLVQGLKRIAKVKKISKSN